MAQGDASITDQQRRIAQECLAAAESNIMGSPQIIDILMEAGFEGYWVDYRNATATYHLPEGAGVTLQAHAVATPIALKLDTEALRAAIGEAQRGDAGYTYRGFCEKTAAAGCAGYLVSFAGRRALYIGRDAATPVEHFPPAP